MYSLAALNKFIIINDIDVYLERLDWNYKLAVVSSIERAQYFTTKRHFDLYSFNHPNQVYGYTLKFLMRPHFPLANELNRLFIGQASESGLINNWLNNYRSQFKTKYQSEIMYLKLENATLMLVIAAFLWLSSLSVCLLERIVFRKVRTVGSRRFWRYIEMIIDPDRHFLEKKYNWSLSEHSDRRSANLRSTPYFQKCAAILKSIRKLIHKTLKNLNVFARRLKSVVMRLCTILRRSLRL